MLRSLIAHNSQLTTHDSGLGTKDYHAILTFQQCPFCASSFFGISTSLFIKTWLPENTVCLGFVCTDSRIITAW